MKKTLIALFSLVICFLLTCTAPLITTTKDTYLLTSDKINSSRMICRNQDSIVSIVNVEENFKFSGVIAYKNGNEYYIASASAAYNSKKNYEIVFSDFNRYQASTAGVSKEDGIVIFKVLVKDKSYCVANTSGNLKTYVGEKVNVFAKGNFLDEQLQTYVNKVGVCKNCGEETYKNYFYSRLTLGVGENFLGAGIFNLNNQFVGMLTHYVDDYKFGTGFIDSNRILDIITKLEYLGKYEKNYIRYNLLNVSELTQREKYLYSVSDEVSRGVVVTSLHYINYFTFGLNQGMVILAVNGVEINDTFDFDYEISKYKKGSYLDLKVRTIVGLYRTIKVKI